MAKEKKPRAHKYDQKVSIDGTFDQVIRVSVGKAPIDNTPEPESKSIAHSIRDGDRVRVKDITNPHAPIELTVVDVDGDEIVVEILGHRVMFKADELILVYKGDGGFVPEGH